MTPKIFEPLFRSQIGMLVIGVIDDATFLSAKDQDPQPSKYFLEEEIF